MRRYSVVGILLIGLPCIAVAQLTVSIFGGLATPSEAINDVYNRSNIGTGDTLRDLIRDAARMGYQLGLRTQTGLSDRFHLISGIALVRFPQSRIYVTDPRTRDTIVVLTAVQNLIPITAGIRFTLLPSLLRLHGSAQLSYTILNSSTDIERGTLSVPLTIGTQNNHRIGADVGIGADIGLGPVGIGAEVRYAVSNLIGRVGGEAQKNYLSLLLVLTLGL
ncbi:MAG: hypothetical protein RMJ46_02835 [Bacteroidota bacterium]|nr:hypothetical protein [Bacteroidota bacterium]